MKVFRRLADVPPEFGPVVATIGNFDGVHRGHRWVVSEVIARARALNAKSLAITLDPHPVRVLRPASTLKLITPLEEKLALLAVTGLDAALVLPFDLEFSRLTAHEFAARVLHDAVRAIELHEGEDFRFGHNAQAGIDGLQGLGRELEFVVRAYPPRSLRGGPVSSSRIRQLIAAGDVSHARALLGYPFTVLSTPAPGRGYGTKYTVPTINLAEYTELLPGNGVYVTRMGTGSGDTAEVFDAVTNVGNRPTFGEDSFTVETHLLDFHPIDLSETTTLRLSFLKRLRPEIKWPNPEALKQQIGRDVARAKRYFQLCRATGGNIPSS